MEVNVSRDGLCGNGRSGHSGKVAYFVMNLSFVERKEMMDAMWIFFLPSFVS